MICVKVVAFRKDMKDMSRRETMQSTGIKSRPAPVIETNKIEKRTINQGATKP